VELKDGTIYQGILHSHDREKMYLIMPKMHHEQHHHNSMHHEHHHHHNLMHTEDESSSRQFFPFYGPFGLFGFPFFGIRRFGPFFPFFI
jgi:ABC-type nickel/cobalt efflux system permease component RcnA